MKNLKTLLAAILLTSNAFAQTFTITADTIPFEQKIDSLVMNLDLTDVDNGILYETGFLWARFFTSPMSVDSAPERRGTQGGGFNPN